MVIIDDLCLILRNITSHIGTLMQLIGIRAASLIYIRVYLSRLHYLHRAILRLAMSFPGAFTHLVEVSLVGQNNVTRHMSKTSLYVINPASNQDCLMHFSRWIWNEKAYKPRQKDSSWVIKEI